MVTDGRDEKGDTGNLWRLVLVDVLNTSGRVLQLRSEKHVFHPVFFFFF